MPKAEDAPETKRKAPPTRDNTPNQQLQIAPGKGSSQDMFSDMEDEVEFLRVCYYGKEGSAKSTNAATLANTGPIVFVNAEGGAKKRALAARGINTQNIKVWPAPGVQITQALLDDLFYKMKADLIKNPDAWNGVVFDSATDIVQGLTDHVSQHRITRARNKGITIDDVDEYFTDVSDYGTMAKMFNATLRNFRTLPMHVVYTALERRDVDKNSGEVTIGPAVTPGVTTGLLGYVDIVIHCSAGDDEQPYRGLTKAGGIRRVKDRFDMLPRIMVEPTMDRLLDYANGVITPETDERQSLYVPPKSGKKQKAAKETAVEEVTPADADA